MQYRNLGKTGLRVSEIGLGAWQIGGPVRGYFAKLGWIEHGWGEVDDDESIRLIHALGDIGVNFIDTAAVYGNGHSEEVVGKSIQGQRQNWIIETKGGEGFAADGCNWHDYKSATLLNQLEASLKRLGTDYVDVYLLHSPGNSVLAEGECLQALVEIKRSGKARFVGASVGPTQVASLIHNNAVDVFQVPVNILSTPETLAVLKQAGQAGIGIVARGAFGSGFFTGAINESTSFTANDRRSWQSAESKVKSAAVANAFRFLEVPGRSLPQSYLRYLLMLDGVSTVITGSTNTAHMLENAAASEAPMLTAAEIEQIEAVRSNM